MSKKHPVRKDMNQLAKSIVDKATGNDGDNKKESKDDNKLLAVKPVSKK